MSDKVGSSVRLQFRAVNVFLLAAAILSIGVGYILLAQGSTTMAPVSLVLGYCVLFPLGLAL